MAYRPYGEVLYNGTFLPAVPSEARGFIGERFDAGAGLQYLNARYYDPRLGMFLQPDWFEVTEAGVGTNRYAYAGGDPVNASDPGGNAWYDNWDDFKETVRNIFSGAASGAVENADFNATVTTAAAGTVTGAALGATTATAASCYLTVCATAPLATPGGAWAGAEAGFIVGGLIGLAVDGGQVVLGAVVGGYQGAVYSESDENSAEGRAPGSQAKQKVSNRRAIGTGKKLEHQTDNTATQTIEETSGYQLAAVVQPTGGRTGTFNAHEAAISIFTLVVQLDLAAVKDGR